MNLRKFFILSTLASTPLFFSCDEAFEPAVAAEPARPVVYSAAPIQIQEPPTLETIIIPEVPEPKPVSHKKIAGELAAHLTRATTTGAVNGAKARLSNIGLPKNTRQSAEGYWIGAWPTKTQLEELHARNIRLIITAANIGYDDHQDITDAIKDLGMTHVNIPFGGRFPNPDKFDSIIQNYSPEQIYIHCEHGGDRSGAILAYLLIVNHQWTVPRALLAVAFPGKLDSQALVEILKKRGYEVTDEDLEEVLGIYSGENNGGYGGLKVRSEGYVKLINTTIDAALRQLKKRNTAA